MMMRWFRCLRNSEMAVVGSAQGDQEMMSSSAKGGNVE